MRRRRPLALGLLALVTAVTLVVGGFAALVVGPAMTVDPSAPAVAGPRSSGAAATIRGGVSPRALDASPFPDAPTAPAPTAPAVPLPGLIGAIGDSLSAGVNASGQFGVQPQHSWVVGDVPRDGVDSHLERIRALGGDPETAEAFRPGASIAAARGQAEVIVAAARGLPAGTTAYVTFELGANDVCAPTLAAATDPDAFASLARDALERLVGGLPPGSHVLVVSVPDVTRLRDLVAEVPEARALHRRYDVCESVLGEEADTEGVVDRIRAYNATLTALCERLDSASVACGHDFAGDPARSLFGAPFTLDQISSLDFFHPSLSGQARIADETWRLTPWGAPGG